VLNHLLPLNLLAFFLVSYFHNSVKYVAKNLNIQLNVGKYKLLIWVKCIVSFSIGWYALETVGWTEVYQKCASRGLSDVISDNIPPSLWISLHI